MTADQLVVGPVLTALQRHEVAFVVIGGYAARLHGALRPTTDIDIVPATGPQNLERLAAALTELGVRVRTDAVDGGLPISVSAGSLRGVLMLNLVTSHGDLDLTFRPAGTEGFDDLSRGAEERVVEGVRVLVASLDDVVRSKEAAARRKDAEALPELYRLLQARRAR